VDQDQREDEMRDKHYDIEEKTEIIAEQIGLGPEELIRPYARAIAETTDCFTFSMLEDLIRALRLIAKGKG
jgi:hypothetical protein